MSSRGFFLTQPNISMKGFLTDHKKKEFQQHKVTCSTNWPENPTLWKESLGENWESISGQFSLNLQRCETGDSVGLFACNFGFIILNKSPNGSPHWIDAWKSETLLSFLVISSLFSSTWFWLYSGNFVNSASKNSWNVKLCQLFTKWLKSVLTKVKFKISENQVMHKERDSIEQAKSVQ